MTSAAPSRTFLVVDDGWTTWGIDAEHVAAVMDEHDWRGSAPWPLSGEAGRRAENCR